MVRLGFEPWPQDGRHRQNHGAMAATQIPKVKEYLEQRDYVIKASQKSQQFSWKASEHNNFLG